MAEVPGIDVAQHPQEAEKEVTCAAGTHLLEVGGCSWYRLITFTPCGRFIVLLDDYRATNFSCPVDREKGAYVFRNRG